MSRSAYSARLAEKRKALLVREAAEWGRRYLRVECHKSLSRNASIQRSHYMRVLEGVLGSLPMRQIFDALDGFRDLLWVSTGSVSYVEASLFKVERLPCEMCGTDVPIYVGGSTGRPVEPRDWATIAPAPLCGPKCLRAYSGMAALNGWTHVPFNQKPGSFGSYAYLESGALRVIPRESRLAWNETNWRGAPSGKGWLW